MRIYFDSAIIAKLYVQELNSFAAVQLVAEDAPPGVLTPWQELEVKNALRLKRFRQELTGVELAASLAAFDEDINSGRWRRSSCNLMSVHARAEELSAVHSAKLGCRTLDILHVAAALVMGTPEFASLDERQRELAGRSGLIVKP